MKRSSEKARKYSRDHAERFRHEPHEFLRIPSLSGDPAHAKDVRSAAEWLAAQLHAMGLENARVMPTAVIRSCMVPGQAPGRTNPRCWYMATTM